MDRDGEVILKKYSPIGELGDFATEYAEALFENTQHVTLICDRDMVIAVAGASKKEYLNKPVGSLVESCMDQRRTHLETEPGEPELFRDTSDRAGVLCGRPDHRRGRSHRPGDSPHEKKRSAHGGSRSEDGRNGRRLSGQADGAVKEKRPNPGAFGLIAQVVSTCLFGTDDSL